MTYKLYVRQLRHETGTINPGYPVWFKTYVRDGSGGALVDFVKRRNEILKEYNAKMMFNDSQECWIEFEQEEDYLAFSIKFNFHTNM